MEEELVNDAGERRVVTSLQERDRLLGQGWRRDIAVQDVAPGGALRVRSATDAEAAGGVVHGGVVPRSLVADELAARDLEERRLREAGQPGQQLAAGASSLASIVTGTLTERFGLSSRAGLEGEQLDAYREATSTPDLIGQTLGALAPWGAEAAIARAGQTAIRGTGWGAAFARGAAEGAAGGALGGLHDAAAGHEDLAGTTERLWAGMGIGALLGGPLGTVGRGVGRLSTRGNPLRRSVDEVMEAADGGLPDFRQGLLGDALRPNQNPGVVGRFREAVGGVGAPGGDPRLVRAAFEAERRFDNMSPDAFNDIAGRVGAAVGVADDAMRNLGRLDNVPLPTSARRPAAMLAARIDMDAAAARLSAVDLPSDAARSLRGRAVAVLRDTTPADLQRVFNVREELNGMIAKISPNDDAMRIVRGELEQVRQGLDGLMDNTQHWGDAADIVRTRRGALDAFRESNRKIGSRLRDNAGPGADVNLPGVNQDALRQAIRQAGDPNGSDAVLRDVYDLADQLQRAKDRGLIDIPDATIKDLRQEMNDIIQMTSARRESRQARGLEGNEANTQQAARQALGGIGMFAGIGMAGAFAGPVGAAAAAAVALGAVFIRSPHGMARAGARMHNALRKQGTRAASSVDGARSIISSPSRNPFSNKISAPAGTVGAALLNGSAQDKREMYEELVARVEALANNPEAIAQSAAAQSQLAGDFHQDLPMHMGMQTQRQIAALQGALPRSRRGNRSLRIIGPPPQPSMTEVNEFLQVASVVEDPIFGVELMRAGRLSDAAARAMAASFPNFQQEVSALLLSHIAQTRMNGGTVNYQSALMVSRFVGYPLDSTMEPGFSSSLSDQSAQTPEQESAQFSRPVSTREPSMLRNEMTPTDRIMQ